MSEWIPVSDHYPEEKGRYLVTTKQKCVRFGIWLGYIEDWDGVIAWMPLPEPYTEGGTQ
jgi:hypothetical protein